MHLGPGHHTRQDSMAAWATRKVLQAMETIVPSSRSNAPQQLDFNFDTRTLGDMMNAVFWKKIGDLGIELGHNEASGAAALADGPPPRRLHFRGGASRVDRGPGPFRRRLG